MATKTFKGWVARETSGVCSVFVKRPVFFEGLWRRNRDSSAWESNIKIPTINEIPKGTCKRATITVEVEG